MKKEQLAVQMFTVRDYIMNLKDFNESCKKIAKIGYKSIQLSEFSGDFKMTDIKKIIDDNGLVCDSTHHDSNEILNNPEKVVEDLNILGAKYTAYPYPTGKLFRTKNQVLEFCDQLNKAGKVLYENDKVLCYHNHNIEFLNIDGEFILDTIYSKTDPKYLQGQIDTYWIQAGGQNPEAWCKKLSGRLPLLHLKDYGVAYGEGNQVKTVIKEIGYGTLNWKEICKIAEEGGTKWFIVEQDICPADPFDSLKMSYDYLVENICEK